MTPEEARLYVTEEIAAVLTDYAIDPDEGKSAEQKAQTNEAMLDVADMIVNMFDLKIASVDLDAGTAQATIKLFPTDEEIQAAGLDGIQEGA
jgi:uncharacterized Zn ribbon protein